MKYVGLLFLIALYGSTSGQGDIHSFGSNGWGELGRGVLKNSIPSPELMASKAMYKCRLFSAGKVHSIAIDSSGYLYTWGQNNYGQLGVGNTKSFNIPQRIEKNGPWAKCVASYGDYSLAINSQGELYSWGKIPSKSSQTLYYFETIPTKVGNKSNWVEIAAGISHSIAINSKGEMYSWGENDYGELGLGNVGDQIEPQRIGSESNWVRAAAGKNFSIAINSDGELFVWGDKQYGKLGLGNSIGFNTPQRLGLSSNWVSISATNEYSLAINRDGELYSWGLGRYGETGTNKTGSLWAPEKVGPDSIKWETATAGLNMSAAIDNDGNLYVWGRNDQNGMLNDSYKNILTPLQISEDVKWKNVSVGGLFLLTNSIESTLYGRFINNYGQLGIGEFTLDKFILSPQIVFQKFKWSMTSASDFTNDMHCLAITTDGKLFSWGRNRVGELGLGEEIGDFVPTPRQIGNKSNWVYVLAGRASSYAINTDGELFAWGSNSNGQLGIGNNENKSIPQLVGTSNNWTNVVSNGGHVLAINTEGEIYAWGDNSYGQLGLGHQIRQNTPQQVGTFSNWIKVSAGAANSLAINSKNEIFSWGAKIPTTNAILKPEKLGDKSNWVEIFAGDAMHSFAINTNGHLYGWGRNTESVLGIENYQQNSIPTLVDSFNYWKSISTSYDHTLGLNNKGELFAWGNNSHGQLGTDFFRNQNTPVRVGELSKWKYISAGHNASYCVNLEGEMFVMGYDFEGRIGLHGRIDFDVPGIINSSENWKQISAGRRHVLAVNQKGELFGWGSNLNGQLAIKGDFYRTPQRIGESTDWIEVSAGNTHSLAINSKGELFYWGGDPYGIRLQESLPTRVGMATNWTKIAAGGYHSLALNSNGELFSWGDNSYGQLGIGNFMDQQLPTQIEGKWESISAGVRHSMALTTQGNLFTWGGNSEGELGIDKVNGKFNEPQAVENIRFTKISAEGRTCIGLTKDKKIYTWGDGAYAYKPRPVQTDSSNWEVIDAGTGHFLAVNSWGELFSWGDNTSGQLGLGTNLDQERPVKVVTNIDWLKVDAGEGFSIGLTGDIQQQLKKDIIKKTDKIAIYPNPTSRYLYLSENKGPLKYTISTIEGQNLSTGTYEGKIDLSNLKTGVYFINIGGYCQKVVKLK